MARMASRNGLTEPLFFMFVHFLPRGRKPNQKKTPVSRGASHFPARRRCGRRTRKLACLSARSDSPRVFIRPHRRCSARDKGNNPNGLTVVFLPQLLGGTKDTGSALGYTLCSVFAFPFNPRPLGSLNPQDRPKFVGVDPTSQHPPQSPGLEVKSYFFFSFLPSPQQLPRLSPRAQ